MTYYGMSLNTPNMDGDPYFNCLVAAATEFLAYGSVWFLIRYTPRRFTLPFTLLLSGALLLFIKLIPDGTRPTKVDSTAATHKHTHKMAHTQKDSHVHKRTHT